MNKYDPGCEKHLFSSLWLHTDNLAAKPLIRCVAVWGLGDEALHRNERCIRGEQCLSVIVSHCWFKNCVL